MLVWPRGVGIAAAVGGLASSLGISDPSFLLSRVSNLSEIELNFLETSSARADMASMMPAVELAW